DANTTIVAQSGALVIGGKVVTVNGPVTLQGLAAAINDTDGIGVTASVVQTDAAKVPLLVAASSSGGANALTVVNNLVDGTNAAVHFTDTNGDGTSGDTPADNSVNATDADVLVNNVEVKSASNTLDSAIPGVTLTLLKKGPSVVGIDVAPDSSSL